MKLFYLTIFLFQIICIFATFKTKQECTCDKIEPYKCECKKCECANED
jgi:hypothetical protein